MKVNDLIEKEIRDGVYEYTSDRKHEDLENYRSFVHRHFEQSNFNKDIWTDKNQPERLFCTAKTHKFINLQDITLNLKFRAIIDQSNSFSSKAAKFLSNDIKLLQDKDYMLYDTLESLELIRKLPPKGAMKEDVSYDVEALFTSIHISKIPSII